MTRIQLSIPTPCSEKFSDFTPTARGGFCAACSKEVIDFTRWTDAELLAWLSARNHTGRTCGRFRDDQLKSYVIHPARKNRTTLIATLTMLTVLLFSRPAAAQEKDVSQTEQYDSTRANAPVQKPISKWMVVSGTVSTAAGPLAGVRVFRTSSEQFTITDSDGHYRMTIVKPAESETIRFHLDGYTYTEQRFYAFNGDRQSVDVQFRQYRAPNEVLMGTVGGFSVAPVAAEQQPGVMDFWWWLR